VRSRAKLTEDSLLASEEESIYGSFHLSYLNRLQGPLSPLSGLPSILVAGPIDKEMDKMTEYEMGELLYNTYDTLWETSQMYFTLVSAYLAVAWLVGTKLTRVQYVIVTALYLFWVAGIIQTQVFTGISTLNLASSIASQGEQLLRGYGTGSAMVIGIYSFTIVMVCGVFASLYFMWSVRHNKTE
jgi:hypothetical protein